MSRIDGTLKSVRPGEEDVWGPQMWALIDNEMVLKDCSVWSYQPVDDPFEDDEEEGGAAIWALHYFFFNKALKRVCYLHVRGTPVMSHSPRVTRGMLKRAKRVEEEEEDEGRRKRAGYWLGENWEGRGEMQDDDDGLVWNRGVDGEVVVRYDDDSFGEDVEMVSESEEERSVRGVSEDVAGRMEIDV